MIMTYITNHQAEFWLILGFVLLAAEVLTGFTIGVFLFSGLGAIATGLLMTAGLLAETWLVGIASLGICSGLITAILWKPLKKLQGDKPIEKDNSSDLVGHVFTLNQTVTRQQPGLTSYSGISWKVVLDESIDVTSVEAGQQVSVSSVEVGTFKVKPV
jgi:membrane protein implicated in regulation of membrane protease activity